VKRKTNITFSIICGILKKKKDIKAEGELLGKERGMVTRGDDDERLMGGKYDQSTLFAHMTMSYETCYFIT
jgi:hypothetical protein